MASPGNGILPDGGLARLREQGYLIVPNVLDPVLDLAPLRAELGVGVKVIFLTVPCTCIFCMGNRS